MIITDTVYCTKGFSIIIIIIRIVIHRISLNRKRQSNYKASTNKFPSFDLAYGIITNKY